MRKIFFVVAACSILFTKGLLAQAAGRQTIQSQLLTLPVSWQSRDTLPGPVLNTGTNGYQKKSVFLAALFSIILPGAGEYYAEGYSRGKYFTMAEAGLWMTYAGFQIYGNNARNDARHYAAIYAGVQGEGKDDNYYVDIGNYDNIYQYNEKKLQDRRLDLLYDPSAGYAWNWNSTAERQRYRDLRISSDNVLYNSRFIIAVVIANHLVSAISGGKAASDFNKALDGTIGGLQWRICPQIMMTSGTPDGLSVGIETRF